MKPLLFSLLVLLGCHETISLGSDPVLDGGTDSGAKGPDGAVDGSTPDALGDRCYVGGCSSQLCSDIDGLASTCEWTPSYACYEAASCERQTDGGCGWTQTAVLQECLADLGACYVGGCNSEICSRDPGAVSTCAVRPEDACYADARCKRSNAICGWEETPALRACLDEF